MSFALRSNLKSRFPNRISWMGLPFESVTPPDAPNGSLEVISGHSHSSIGQEPRLSRVAPAPRTEFARGLSSPPSIKRSCMKLGSMFLRTDCVLPDGMGLIQRRFGERWMSVENETAATLDAQVRNAGWHFMYLQMAHSRIGIGRTAESATSKAVTRALMQTEGRFHAAELGPVKVTRYPGFHVARATLHTRQIQQHASLGLVDEMVLRQLPVR
jgi:hypothetical protein